MDQIAAKGPVDPFAPAPLGPITLRNRVIKAATFEGVTRQHVVSPRLIEFHREVARGGVGMTTVAYLAVAPDGCGTPNEIILTDDAVPGLAELAEAVHAEGAAVSAQIGHAGAVAAATGHKGLAPSRLFSPLAMRFARAVDDDEIARITADFASAARRLADAGFDAVEVHLGHGYLLSEFLSPRLNRRTDRWGGSLENRSRFARQVVLAVREAVGDRLAVLAKLNMADGVPGGLWLDESVEVARLLEQDGGLDALELTAGSSLQNPMYLFRGEAPIHEMAAVFPQPMKTGFKLFGRRFLPSYPYEEAYLLPYARQFRAALDLPLILLGGINRRDTIERAMAEGFAFVAMGRALLRQPDLVNQLQAGATDEGLCIHCNKCMPTIYRGTHCVLNVAPPGITA
ncbi:MAG TPA: NADH:flavin oxidoreductase [Acidimicrobiales bacterium]|jgi:2,4-dienoyl-CoA reductase-like NADH-dependent reductase (Old Yellow Enzyme family)|nr:NADH:flavin oxidoreductase [Acidimicrobiales bacterium]